ncbi:HD-GYP domain-containing protein [Bacillus sp. EAC]|uniref:HD-GYP domain-containing protein n=1 Tax=Bacillus sp. EAC TaxID=1978338 RepID=UPI000B430D3E|nr:HD-GYP domain-containing protein [Bacillus sp. EAC]
MSLIDTLNLKEGIKIEKPIISKDGKVLVRENIPLTKEMLNRLKKFDFKDIELNDENSERIETSLNKREVLNEIEKVYTNVSNIENGLSVEFVSQNFFPIVDQLIEETSKKRDLSSLLSTVYEYDNYLYEHSLNVALYVLAIGNELRLIKEDLKMLTLGGLLHDIGKLSIPKEILLKEGPLTNEEFSIIKTHPVLGYQMLTENPGLPKIILKMVMEHHEALNGTGYPRGIKEPFIHPFSMIISVADIFDALTTNRSYRKAYLPHQALEILYTMVATKLNIKYVEAFRSAVYVYPKKTFLSLNDGRKGYVIQQNEGLNDRPIISIYEENGKAILPYNLDLSVELTTYVVDVLKK